MALFPFSRGKNRISQGVENRGSLFSVPLALRLLIPLDFRASMSKIKKRVESVHAKGDMQEHATFPKDPVILKILRS